MKQYPLDKFTSLWQYIKIASSLPEKGVRDVALRIRWMSRRDAGKLTKRKADDAGVSSGGSGGSGGSGANGGAVKWCKLNL